MKLGAWHLRRSLRRGAQAEGPRTLARIAQQAVHGSCPVVIPRELLEGFHKAERTPAPFASDISIADHCLQVATDVHYADWVPNIHRRDMVVMALFHDVFYEDSRNGHGEMASRWLQGRLHPNIQRMCTRHTGIGCNSEKAGVPGASKAPTATAAGREELATTNPMAQRMLDSFMQLDCNSTGRQRTWQSLDFFQKCGYFREPKPDEAATMPSWLSPNNSLVWAAPSMWIERTPILLANSLKLFQAAGLPPVELRISDGGPELLRLVQEGQAHIAEIGLFPWLAAMEGPMQERPPARLVGSSFMQQLDHYLASGNPAVTDLQGLRGRRVGVLSRGSCDSYLLQAILREAGVDPAEVTEVPLGALYGKLEVLQEGHVDATFLVEPYLSQLEEMGVAKVLTKASSIYPRFQWGALMASNHVVSEAPDLVCRVLDVYADACRLMREAVIGGEPKEVLDALLELGPSCFDVSGVTLLHALRRDLASWQMDWRSVDTQGVTTCASIQRGLGAISDDVSIDDMFDAGIRGSAR